MPGLPKITFKEFASNPIVALMFLSLTATATLWYQNTSTLEAHISEYKNEIKQLKQDNRELRDKYIEVLTELRSLQQ